MTAARGKRSRSSEAQAPRTSAAAAAAPINRMISRRLGIDDMDFPGQPEQRDCKSPRRERATNKIPVTALVAAPAID
jgi:hypothetical protein